MKITAYYFDNYTWECIWIAAMLWPFFYVAFRRFYYDKPMWFSLTASLILASFTCLVFADTLFEYLVYFLGVGILLFGCMAMCNPNRKSFVDMIIGILFVEIGSIILYYTRKVVYKRPPIPNTPGDLNTFYSPGGMFWNIIMIFMYMPVILFMIKK